MTRSVEVSLARSNRRKASSCSSDLTLLLSRCASFASFTDVWETSGPSLSNFAWSSSRRAGMRLRVAILMAVVISVFFSKAEEQLSDKKCGSESEIRQQLKNAFLMTYLSVHLISFY